MRSWEANFFFFPTTNTNSKCWSMTSTFLVRFVFVFWTIARLLMNVYAELLLIINSLFAWEDCGREIFLCTFGLEHSNSRGAWLQAFLWWTHSRFGFNFVRKSFIDQLPKTNIEEFRKFVKQQIDTDDDNNNNIDSDLLSTCNSSWFLPNEKKKNRKCNF